MRELNFPPAYISNSAANILNCNITSEAGPVGFTAPPLYLVLTHIRVVNTDSAPHTFSLYKGVTAGSTGGTEFWFKGVTVPANSYVDAYGKARFDAADFLSGIADAASHLVINIDGNIGLA